jgi:hypothetical protein
MQAYTVRQEPPMRYGAVSQVLHWATAALVVWAFTNGLGGSESRVYMSSASLSGSSTKPSAWPSSSAAP